MNLEYYNNIEYVLDLSKRNNIKCLKIVKNKRVRVTLDLYTEFIYWGDDRKIKCIIKYINENPNISTVSFMFICDGDLLLPLLRNKRITQLGLFISKAYNFLNILKTCSHIKNIRIWNDHKIYDSKYEYQHSGTNIPEAYKCISNNRNLQFKIKLIMYLESKIYNLTEWNLVNNICNYIN